jgi:AcrR family transcriptional regulator
VRGIARRAHVDPALVGYYFRSRDGLLRAVIEEAAREGRERFVAAGVPSDGTEGRLRAVITHLLNVLAREPYLPRLVVEHVVLGDARVRTRYVREVVAPVATAIVEIVEEGKRRGELRDVDPPFVLQSLIGTCVFFFLAAPVAREALGIEPGDPAVVDAFARHTVELVVRGILR